MQGKTQAEIAKHKIEEMFVFGELDTKTLYSENKIANILNLGRTPVREALQYFERVGMLTVHPKKGIEFQAVTSQHQLQIIEARRQIEPTCIVLALERSTATQKKRMLELGDEIIKSADEKSKINSLYSLQEIHSILCEATHNPYLSHALTPLHFSSRAFWFHTPVVDDDFQYLKIYKNFLDSLVVGNLEDSLKYYGLKIDALGKFTFRLL